MAHLVAVCCRPRQNRSAGVRRRSARSHRITHHAGRPAGDDNAAATSCSRPAIRSRAASVMLARRNSERPVRRFPSPPSSIGHATHCSAARSRVDACCVGPHVLRSLDPSIESRELRCAVCCPTGTSASLSALRRSPRFRAPRLERGVAHARCGPQLQPHRPRRARSNGPTQRPRPVPRTTFRSTPPSPGSRPRRPC